MKALFGRTIFARVFCINIITVAVCLIVLGSTQIVLVNQYISRQNEETLKKNGESIVALLKNENIDVGSLRGILSGFSRSSHSHIMVIDSKGKVLVNTTDSGFLPNEPDYIPNEYTQSVLAGQRNSIIGTLGGMFSETMFTLQMPIQQGSYTLGAVLISIPIPQKQRMVNELIQILLISAMGVAMISFLLSYMLSKRLSRPIKTIQTSAKAFTKGHFDARVGKTATESGITEIAQLAQTFNEMAFELEKVEEIRQSFISDVSHELRTPMTTISGFVYGMIDDTIPAERQKEYLQIVYDEVTRLSRLVNTFLDISRMQADKATLNKSHFDINEAIRLTIIGLEQRLKEKHIDVALNFDTDSCYVFADSDGIKRVLTNLLDNAVKFTNEGGTITVTVKPKQHEVYITVHNTGCGIPGEQHRMIFERLYKVDKSRSINREGTGIGLYLVKSIIRAHGKNITVRSTEGEFAEFVFALDKGKAPGKREEKRLEPME